MNNPAENLLGKSLENGWIVTEKINKMAHSSGGNFSICYKVQRGSEIGFLKALDISRILRAQNFMKILEFATKAHNYECEILKLCAERRMSKVVSIIEHNEIIPDESDTNNIPVHYLIFELADKTARDHVALSTKIENAWLMRSMHNVAVGLNQLHSLGIAHQDVKPSNVLLFDKKGSSKIADLGRAEHRGNESVYVNLNIAGDPAYAPPELLYNHLDPDWNKRRKATDLYHLGSLLVFYYQKTHMTALLKSYLPSSYHWQNWNGDYDLVLPYLNEAFEAVLLYMEKEISIILNDNELAKEIIKIISQLCNPNPQKRGHPHNRMFEINKYSLEKYISWFDKLTRTFETRLI